MDDLNNEARLHSAGATIRHASPFASLPSHINRDELAPEFVKKWAVPFYMEIGSNQDDTWIKDIEHLKSEITAEICLRLLGDFNWRTRLVGSYLTAVKGYKEHLDIIGTHLLKSEVCCVGHIYALTLAFFNDPNYSRYLFQYLDYYLTRPDLYFDQDHVMNAVLFLDKQNKTDSFSGYLDQWNFLSEQRIGIESKQSRELAKMLGEPNFSNDMLGELKSPNAKTRSKFSTEYFDTQVEILRRLSE